MQPKEQLNYKHNQYYFTTRDLVIIALLSALGGVLSAYIGYLGNLVNKLFGVPFGAGQFMAGLHVFWFVLVRGLVRKNGAGALAGLLKGLVELLAGSTHGVVIVIVSFVEGFILDLAMFLLRRENPFSFSLAAGLAAAGNVFVFQIFYLSQVPVHYILLIAAFALVSGVVFGGYFGSGVTELVRRQGILRHETAAGENDLGNPIARRVRLAASLILTLALTGGAFYYYTQVYEPFWAGPVCRVEGKVQNPFNYRVEDFKLSEVTVNAELKGQVTYQPARDYTGVRLKDILAEAVPLEDARSLQVIASDGYAVNFKLNDVLQDDELILIKTGDSFQIVGAHYEGGYWVKDVCKMVVE